MTDKLTTVQNKTGWPAILVSLLLILSGCATTDTTQRQQRPVDPIQVEITQLLREADLAIEINQLTTPRGDNAFERFQKVLQLEPGNEAARQGINRIAETYLAWALDNAERSNFSRARQYVTKAEQIDRGHPNIRPVVNRINDLEDSNIAVFKLSAKAVRDRSVPGGEFNRIARSIQKHNAFVEIRAPTDASGRWIYQQLNQRVDKRITARFIMSTQPSVTLDI